MVTRSPAERALREIPGIGPSLAHDLYDLGMRAVPDLTGRDPRALYERLSDIRGARMDPCVLYTFRCAVYYASTPDPDPELLAWWRWKNRRGATESPPESVPAPGATPRFAAREPGEDPESTMTPATADRSGAMPAAAWDAILFDLDGTLANTVELILRCYRHTMRAHLGAERPDAEWLATMGTPLAEQMRAFARSDEEGAAMVGTYVAFQKQVHDTLVRPYPGVPSALDALADAAVPMALVTSKRLGMTRRTLDVCGILHHFAVIVTPDEVARPKPHPESVLAALERLDAGSPERVLFVGDSPFDLAAGRAAGTRTAAATWGPFSRDTLLGHAPDFVLDRIEDLMATSPASASRPPPLRRHPR